MKKLTLSNYFYKFTAEKYPKENFSFGVYNVIEERGSVVYGLFWTKFFAGFSGQFRAA